MVCFYSVIEKNITFAYSIALHVQSVRRVKFVKQCGCRDPRAPSLSPKAAMVTLTGSATVTFFCRSTKIEFALNETSGKLVKMLSFAHENHENSFFFFFFGSICISLDVIESSTFDFKTRRHSYFPLETGANCQTIALKRIKKIDFAFYR